MTRQSILLDTNIFSIFAEITRFDLLLAVLDKHKLYISPTVHSELSIGLSRGHIFLQQVLDFIGENQPIAVVKLTSNETRSLKMLSASLAPGEAESIVVCQHRGWVFTSFDRKAVNFCKHNNIAVLTLNNILAAAWKGNFVSKDEIKEIIRQLEAKGRIIKAKNEILKE